jgi:hypothetical protein
MQIARYGHSVEFLNNNVYVIGGTDQTHSPSSTVEKMSIFNQEWEFATKLNYNRSKCRSTVSHESNTIYVIGGAEERLKNNILEAYKPVSDYWQEIELTLDFQIIPERTHMFIYNEYTKLSPSTSDASIYDPDDKILFVHYDNIIYPVPDIYFLSIGHGVIEELKYDKTNSVISTYFKNKLIYDRKSKKILAFSMNNYTVVDYMDITDEF